MDLFKKVYPKKLENIIFYNDQINSMMKWIENFKNNSDRTKKVLLIIGDTGSGKTCIANLLLKKFEYQIIELNSSDVRSQKKIGDFLHKSLGFNNVLDLFYERKRPIGLIMDEIETLCQNTDKGGLSEFIQILKDNQKYEKNKKKIEDSNKRSKSKKNDKVIVDMNKFIHIENPIICTYTNNNDKKINELKKFSYVVELKDIKTEDYKKFIKSIGKIEKIDIPLKFLKEVVIDCQNDIRKFIQSIENFQLCKSNKNIDMKNYNMIKSLNDTTKNDIQLIDAIRLFFNNKLNTDKLDLLFYLEPYHLPYTIYQNIHHFLSCINIKEKNKFEIYSNYLESLSDFDKTNNLLYENNDWCNVDNYLRLYGVYYPNYYINKYKFKEIPDIPVEFTNIHNKASQMLVNKKLIQNAKYSFNKKYISNKNTILESQLLFDFFNEFREIICEEKFDNLEKMNLIQFMNKNKINYENLENILKIEKINKDEDKRKKNITVLLKEKIIENLDITLRT